MFKKIDVSKTKMVISPLYHVKYKKISNGKKVPLKFYLQDWLRFNPGLICSNIFLRSATFKKLKMLDSRLVYSADRDFMIRFCLNKFKYSILNRPMVFYTLSNQVLRSKKNIIYFKSNLRFYIKYFFLMNFKSHAINLLKLLIISGKIIFNLIRLKI